MALSASDQQRLEQAFSVIRENGQLANKIIRGVENKTWDLVANVLNEVLDWLGYTLRVTINIAKEIGSAILDVLDDLFS
jgi:hypothetical protein